MPFRLWFYLAKIGGPILWGVVLIAAFSSREAFLGWVLVIGAAVLIPLCVLGATMGLAEFFRVLHGEILFVEPKRPDPMLRLSVCYIAVAKRPAAPAAKNWQAATYSWQLPPNNWQLLPQCPNSSEPNSPSDRNARFSWG